MAKSGTGGGAATHSGTDYQNRCSAWFAVLILAEREASPSPCRTHLELLARDARGLTARVARLLTE